jgi:hypothetical protein
MDHMPDKINEQLHKKDLELILEVNKKAVEIETEVAEQNEMIVSLLTVNKERQDAIDKKLDQVVNEKLDKIVKQNEDISRDIFKVQVLFITGLLSLVIQVIQIFLKH